MCILEDIFIPLIIKQRVWFATNLKKNSFTSLQYESIKFTFVTAHCKRCRSYPNQTSPAPKVLIFCDNSRFYIIYYSNDYLQFIHKHCNLLQGWNNAHIHKATNCNNKPEVATTLNMTQIYFDHVYAWVQSENKLFLRAINKIRLWIDISKPQNSNTRSCLCEMAKVAMTVRCHIASGGDAYFSAVITWMAHLFTAISFWHISLMRTLDCLSLSLSPTMLINETLENCNFLKSFLYENVAKQTATDHMK